MIWHTMMRLEPHFLCLHFLVYIWSILHWICLSWMLAFWLWYWWCCSYWKWFTAAYPSFCCPPKIILVGHSFYWQTKQNVKIFKVVFKIHLRPFWVILVKKNFGWKWGGVPILSHFPAIFGFWKFLQVFDISRGQKTLFFKSAPIMVLFQKKIHYFFRYNSGGGESDRIVTFVTIFFFKWRLS